MQDRAGVGDVRAAVKAPLQENRTENRISGLGRSNHPTGPGQFLSKETTPGRQVYFRDKQKNQSFDDILFLPGVPVHITGPQLYSFGRFLNYSEVKVSLSFHRESKPLSLTLGFLTPPLRLWLHVCLGSHFHSSAPTAVQPPPPLYILLL